MKKPKDTTARHYIDNKEFLAAMIEYRKTVTEAVAAGVDKPQVPEYIGECLIKIANQLAFKNNFINYSFREDMILDAIENCLTYIDNFDQATPLRILHKSHIMHLFAAFKKKSDSYKLNISILNH